MNKLFAFLHSGVLKAHSAAIAAGLAVLASSLKDGSLSQADLGLILAAVVGAWGIVYRVPNK